MSGATWHDYVASTWLCMRKTHGKWRERETEREREREREGEREDKSEMKIFSQNILEKKRILESEWKFPLTCLKSNPFLVLEDQFIGGVEERKQKKKEKGKREGKVKIKGKVKKKEKKKREKRN